MAGHTDLSRDVDIDIVGLFSNIWRKKRLILLLSAVVGTCIYMVMSSISPRYQTTAQLIIEPRESEFTRVREPSSSGIDASEFDAAAVLSQVQIILSDSIALGTIKKLNLATIPEFGDNAEPSILSKLVELAGLRNESLAIPLKERVLKAFKSQLKAYSIKDSRVIEILFWANDRQLAKEITNTIADEYLLVQRDSKLEAGANATKFLEPEIANLREKVRLAEARVAEFRSSSDILHGSNNSLLATQQLSEVSTELSRIRAQRSAAEAKIESIRSSIKVGSSLEAIPEVIASPLIQRLRERQVQLRAQISEMSITLLSAHPRLKSLKSQLKDFENQIRREARGILASLENNAKILRVQESSLVEELTRLKAESARAGEAEVELRALERDAVSERELLQAYLSKYQEAAGRQSSKYLPVNARQITWAHLPDESYYPKTIPYSIAGTLVTAILTMVGVLVVSLLNGKALRTVEDSGVPVGHKTIKETSEKIHIPVQPEEAVVPGLQSVSEKQQIVSDPVELKNPDIRASQADMPEFIARPPLDRTGQKTDTLPPLDRTRQKTNTLPLLDKARQKTDALPPLDRAQQKTDALPPLDRVRQKTDAFAESENFGNTDTDRGQITISLVSEGLLGMGNSRIAVISPGGDQGSLTTWLLARKLAEYSKSVAVIDMTGSGITTKRMLGDTSLRGVGDILAGTVEFWEVTYRDQHSSVDVIGVGSFDSQDADTMQERLTILVDSLSDRYDYSIIDCGITDELGLAQVANADTVVVISAVGSNEAKAIESEFLQIGYPETICVLPTHEEALEDSNVAA